MTKTMSIIRNNFLWQGNAWQLLKNKLQTVFQGVALLKTTPYIIESFSGSGGTWQLLKKKIQVIFQGEEND